MDGNEEYNLHDEFLDLDTAEQQRKLIGPNTIVDLITHVNLPEGKDGQEQDLLDTTTPVEFLHTASDGDSKNLSLKFVVTSEGEHRGNVIFERFTVSGNREGHKTAIEISRRKLRAMVESARNIKPTDFSDDAKKARRLKGYGELNGLAFVARVGVQKSKDYPDKNTIAEIITPDRPAWHPTIQGNGDTPATSASHAVEIKKPDWSK